MSSYTKVNPEELKTLASTIQKAKNNIDTCLTEYKNNLNKINEEGYLQGVANATISTAYSKLVALVEEFGNYGETVRTKLNEIATETEKIDESEGKKAEDVYSQDPLTFGVAAANAILGASASEQAAQKTNVAEPSVGSAMDVPSGDTSFKSYTNYEKVTDKSTTAYAINNGKPMPYGKYEGQTFDVKTDDTGMRYVDKGDGKKYYTVAMGTYYGTEGDTFKVKTDAGNEFDVIIVDAKGSDTNNFHSSGGSWYHSHGTKKDLVEFYISSPDSIRVKGGTTGDYNSDARFKGNITSIEKYN